MTAKPVEGLVRPAGAQPGAGNDDGAASGAGATLDGRSPADSRGVQPGKGPRGEAFANLVRLTVAGVSFAVGCILLVAVASTATLARCAGAAANTPPGCAAAGWSEIVLYVVAAVVLGAGAVTGARAVHRLPSLAERDRTRYDRYLVGLGYSLVLLAVLNFVALAGFAYEGRLQQVLGVEIAGSPGGATKPGATAGSVAAGGGNRAAARSAERLAFFLFVPDFAVLGALFFFANSMRGKRDAPPRVEAQVQADADAAQPAEGGAASAGSAAPGADSPKRDVRPPAEPFEAARFWGGLWFRVGEALLFSLVVFLFAAAPGAGKSGGAWLLLMALLLGMFVKTGESLVAGLADRVFAAARQLVK